MQHSNHRAAALIASKPARIITSAALAVALTATPMLSPVAAYAASQATQDQLSAAQQKIEAATSAYNDARTKLDDLQKQIDSNEASIEEIEAKLPEQQAKASSAMRDLYKYQKGTNPIVSFLVNAQSLGEFITTCKYTNQITSSSVDVIEQLNKMQTELEQNKAELQQAKSQLEAEQKNAEDALAQAQQLRSEAQAKAEQENAAELAKLEADKAAAAEKLSGEGVSGSNSSSQATNTNTTKKHNTPTPPRPTKPKTPKNTKQTQNLHITRKYPIERIRTHDRFLMTTSFECYPDSLYDKPDTTYHISNPKATEFNTIRVSTEKPCRYWQYRNRRYGDIAELQFYDSEGKLLPQPKIEGRTENENECFDEDVLSYGSFGYTIQFDFGAPVAIAEIRLLPRNDANGIYPGDLYELFYYGAEGWISLGSKTADDYFLEYENAPTHCLFWLRNLSRGREERIFTYENGIMRFW